jgi:hopanoid biosynthesis associated RND transporter like protein HpnN
MAVLSALASVTLFCTKVEYFTRRTDLASPDKEYQKRWQKFLNEFGDEDDIVVVVRGKNQESMKAALEEVADHVRREVQLFDRLFYKVDLTHLRNRALLFLPNEQLQAIRENLDRMGPLLSAPLGPLAWRSLTMVNLLRQARERAGRLDPDAPLAPADEQFLTQLVALVRTAKDALADPTTYRNPWGSLVPVQPDERSALLDEPRYFFSGDQRLAFLLARPVKAADSFTPALASVDRMRSIIAAVRPRFADVEIGLTGLPVLETDEMAASQRDSMWAGWLALLGTALLYAVVYRGLRYPLLTVSTLLTGTAWAMGWLTLTVGHLNILSATFAVMIIGLGDYGVLWVTRYEQRRRLGDTPHEATRQTAVHVGPSILTAASTTALAFFATMLADFRAVAELGWIAGWGVLFCALACFTILPAMIRLTDRRGLLAPLAVVVTNGERQPVYQPLKDSPAWLPGLTTRPRWVLAVAIVLLVVGAALGTRLRYDHNLLAMQAAGLDSVKWEHELINATAGASWHAASIAQSPQEALALKARYEQLPGVSRVVEVASLIPDQQRAKINAIVDIDKRLKHLPPADQPIAPLTSPAKDAQKEATLLLGALRPQAPLSKQPVIRELVQALEQLRDHPVFDNGPLAKERVHAIETRLIADLVADLYRLRSVAAAKTIDMNDLPENLRERYIGQSGTWLVEAYAKENLWEMAPLETFVQQIRTVDSEATGKPFGTLEGLQSMQRGFAWAGVYALIVIVTVLALDFRSVKHTVLALVPLMVGVIWLVGVLVVSGCDLNPANMIALPLIVGAGVDNGVHVLHDYRSRRRRPYLLDRSTGLGICVSALTTVLGFGSLMISSHRGMAGLGFVLAVGVTCCMIAALVLLPALLRIATERRERSPLKKVA